MTDTSESLGPGRIASTVGWMSAVRSARHLRTRSIVLLGGIVLLGAALRFADLGHNSLWFDEAFVAWLTRASWPGLLAALKAMDAHPPLYYLLMKAWVGVAGTGEVALRIPSACFSTITIVLTYMLMRRSSSELVSLLSAFLVSVSPFAIMAGQEARMYSLLGLLTLASTLALLRCVDHGRVLGWVAYVVLATLTAYTQYLGFLVLIAHGIWVACCARRSLRTWVVAMIAAAGLYAPWIPTLWSQAIQGNGLPYSRYPTSYPDLSDLFGLFAFGGSLFGMGSYFFPGTLAPILQVLILAPFLVVLWRGAAALASDPRSLASLGIPPAFALIVMCVLSFAKFTFYPRWFSFLLPFYAMFLARGMVEVAERIPLRWNWLLAGLTAGLLLPSAPVLGRYYFDPGFRPYPWRDAAELVRRQSRPGDLFLFVNNSAQISFSYYFRDPHPSLTLIPVEASSRARRQPTFTEARVRQLATRYPRVWIIATPPLSTEMQERLLPRLTTAYRFVGGHTFPAIFLNFLEAKTPPR